MRRRQAFGMEYLNPFFNSDSSNSDEGYVGGRDMLPDPDADPRVGERHRQRGRARRQHGDNRGAIQGQGQNVNIVGAVPNVNPNQAQNINVGGADVHQGPRQNINVGAVDVNQGQGQNTVARSALVANPDQGQHMNVGGASADPGQNKNINIDEPSAVDRDQGQNINTAGAVVEENPTQDASVQYRARAQNMNVEDSNTEKEDSSVANPIPFAQMSLNNSPSVDQGQVRSVDETTAGQALANRNPGNSQSRFRNQNIRPGSNAGGNNYRGPPVHAVYAPVSRHCRPNIQIPPNVPPYSPYVQMHPIHAAVRFLQSNMGPRGDGGFPHRGQSRGGLQPRGRSNRGMRPSDRPVAMETRTVKTATSAGARRRENAQAISPIYGRAQPVIGEEGGAVGGLGVNRSRRFHVASKSLGASREEAYGDRRTQSVVGQKDQGSSSYRTRRHSGNTDRRQNIPGNVTLDNNRDEPNIPADGYSAKLRSNDNVDNTQAQQAIRHVSSDLKSEDKDGGETVKAKTRSSDESNDSNNSSDDTSAGNEGSNESDNSNGNKHSTKYREKSGESGKVDRIRRRSGGAKGATAKDSTNSSSSDGSSEREECGDGNIGRRKSRDSGENKDDGENKDNQGDGNKENSSSDDSRGGGASSGKDGSSGSGSGDTGGSGSGDTGGNGKGNGNRGSGSGNGSGGNDDSSSGGNGGSGASGGGSGSSGHSGGSGGSSGKSGGSGGSGGNGDSGGGHGGSEGGGGGGGGSGGGNSSEGRVGGSGKGGGSYDSGCSGSSEGSANCNGNSSKSSSGGSHGCGLLDGGSGGSLGWDNSRGSGGNFDNRKDETECDENNERTCPDDNVDIKGANSNSQDREASPSDDRPAETESPRDNQQNRSAGKPQESNKVTSPHQNPEGAKPLNPDTDPSQVDLENPDTLQQSDSRDAGTYSATIPQVSTYNNSNTIIIVKSEATKNTKPRIAYFNGMLVNLDVAPLPGLSYVNQPIAIPLDMTHHSYFLASRIPDPGYGNNFSIDNVGPFTQMPITQQMYVHADGTQTLSLPQEAHDFSFTNTNTQPSTAGEPIPPNSNLLIQSYDDRLISAGIPQSGDTQGMPVPFNREHHILPSSQICVPRRVSPMNQHQIQPLAAPAAHATNQPQIQPLAAPAAHVTNQPFMQSMVASAPHMIYQPALQPITVSSALMTNQPQVQPVAVSAPYIINQPTVQPAAVSAAHVINHNLSHPVVASETYMSNQPLMNLITASPNMTNQPPMQSVAVSASHIINQPPMQPVAVSASHIINQPPIQPMPVSVSHVNQPPVQHVAVSVPHAFNQPPVQPVPVSAVHVINQSQMQPVTAPAAYAANQPNVQLMAPPTTYGIAQSHMHTSVSVINHPQMHPGVPSSSFVTSQSQMQPVVLSTSHVISRCRNEPVVCSSNYLTSQHQAQPVARPVAHEMGQARVQLIAGPTVPVISQHQLQPAAYPTASVVSHSQVQPVVHPTVSVISQPQVQPVAYPTASVGSHSQVQSEVHPTVSVISQPQIQPIVHPTASVISQPQVQPVAYPTASVVSHSQVQPVVHPTVSVISQPQGQPVPHPTALVSHSQIQPMVHPSAYLLNQSQVHPVVPHTPYMVNQPQLPPVIRPTAHGINQPHVQQLVSSTTNTLNQPTAQPVGHVIDEPHRQVAVPHSAPMMSPQVQDMLPHSAPIVGQTQEPVIPYSVPMTSQPEVQHEVSHARHIMSLPQVQTMANHRALTVNQLHIPTVAPHPASTANQPQRHVVFPQPAPSANQPQIQTAIQHLATIINQHIVRAHIPNAGNLAQNVNRDINLQPNNTQFRQRPPPPPPPPQQQNFSQRPPVRMPCPSFPYNATRVGFNYPTFSQCNNQPQANAARPSVSNAVAKIDFDQPAQFLNPARFENTTLVMQPLLQNNSVRSLAQTETAQRGASPHTGQNKIYPRKQYAAGDNASPFQQHCQEESQSLPSTHSVESINLSVPSTPFRTETHQRNSANQVQPAEQPSLTIDQIFDLGKSLSHDKSVSNAPHKASNISTAVDNSPRHEEMIIQSHDDQVRHEEDPIKLEAKHQESCRLTPPMGDSALAVPIETPSSGSNSDILLPQSSSQRNLNSQTQHSNTPGLLNVRHLQAYRRHPSPTSNPEGSDIKENESKPNTSPDQFEHTLLTNVQTQEGNLSGSWRNSGGHRPSLLKTPPISKKIKTIKRAPSVPPDRNVSTSGHYLKDFILVGKNVVESLPKDYSTPELQFSNRAAFHDTGTLSPASVERLTEAKDLDATHSHNVSLQDLKNKSHLQGKRGVMMKKQQTQVTHSNGEVWRTKNMITVESVPKESQTGLIDTVENFPPLPSVAGRGGPLVVDIKKKEVNPKPKPKHVGIGAIAKPNNMYFQHMQAQSSLEIKGSGSTKRMTEKETTSISTANVSNDRLSDKKLRKKESLSSVKLDIPRPKLTLNGPYRNLLTIENPPLCPNYNRRKFCVCFRDYLNEFPHTAPRLIIPSKKANRNSLSTGSEGSNSEALSDNSSNVEEEVYYQEDYEQEVHFIEERYLAQEQDLYPEEYCEQEQNLYDDECFHPKHFEQEENVEEGACGYSAVRHAESEAREDLSPKEFLYDAQTHKRRNGSAFPGLTEGPRDRTESGDLTNLRKFLAQHPVGGTTNVHDSRSGLGLVRGGEAGDVEDYLYRTTASGEPSPVKRN